MIHSGVYGDVTLDHAPKSEAFVPFIDLTKSPVIGWGKHQFGAKRVTELEQALETDIVNQKSPRAILGRRW
jgi:hypothetical protein